MEGAGHGIASTDCFELFGFPDDAPNLRDDVAAPNAPGMLPQNPAYPPTERLEALQLASRLCQHCSSSVTFATYHGWSHSIKMTLVFLLRS